MFWIGPFADCTIQGFLLYRDHGERRLNDRSNSDMSRVEAGLPTWLHFPNSTAMAASSAAFMLLWISRPAWHTADENDPGAENVPGLVDRWLTGQQVLSWLTRWEAMRCLKDQVQSAPGVKGMAVCGESESCQCVLRVV